jgi:hypothetical protein
MANMMAKTRSTGGGQRKRKAKGRSQSPNQATGTWTKRDDKSGRVMKVKAGASTSKRHGALTKELRQSARQFAGALKRLADR